MMQSSIQSWHVHSYCSPKSQNGNKSIKSVYKDGFRMPTAKKCILGAPDLRSVYDVYPDSA